MTTISFGQFKQALEANHWKLLDCSQYRLNKTFCAKYGHDSGYILKSPKGAWYWCGRLRDIEIKLRQLGTSYYQLLAAMSEPDFVRLNDKVGD